MRLKIKLVHVLLKEQRHLVKFLMKTGLKFFTWLERKRITIFDVCPQRSKIIYPILM